MEGEAISATIEVLLQNLINLSKDEILLIRGLDENAEKLRDTLDMVQSYLEDAQTKSITEAAVKTWLKKLEEKVFEADNALDELNYQLLSNSRKKKVGICFPSFDHCVKRRDLALRINEINTSFESINKRAAELGLQEKLAAAPAAASDAIFETHSFTVDPIFIGRDDDVSKLVEMLTTPNEEAVSILPIVGMGGLGKTTLARKVFNHPKTKSHFGKLIWIHVSRDFDAGVLFKKILANLKPEKVEVESKEHLLKKLQEALEAQNDDAVFLLKNMLTNLEGGNNGDLMKEVVMKKIQEALKATTYLLVLDDIWNEDQQKWEDFLRSLSGITSTNGNGIIVTTRNAGVGSLVKTLDMHLLNVLSNEECWSIIKERACEGGSITPDLEEMGRSIAERCQGLPLAANVVGGVLRGKSKDEWRSIKENWLSEVGGEENYISRILKLSVHYLPSSSLKKCFAHCSIFKKGAQIDKQKLIELWMAEGFLQHPSQTNDMEIVGNNFLKLLLQNSLLQVVDRDEYGEIKICSMHDLVHDVADSISNNIYYKRDQSSPIPKDQAKLLRTLIYNGRISDMVFSNFKSLHALTLMNYDVKKLPDSIGELTHLRLLDISDTCIRYLPNSIGKLSYLQTMRYSHPNWRPGLKKLPITLKHLFNLRHLYLADDDTRLPPHLGRLTSLQTLSFFQVRNKEGYRIVELESLKNLKGDLEIQNLERVRGEEESKKAYLCQKAGIMKLRLRWSRGGRKGKINHVNVLKGLQPHPNIKILRIVGFGGASFPTWTSSMAVFHEARWVGLNNLTEIRLERCSECEEIPTLGHLPHLKSLYLFEMDKIKCIGASFYGIEESSSNDVFPALEILELQYMPNLTEWEDVNIPSGAQVKVFPCLEYFRIVGCQQLRSAPSHEFTSLRTLEIYGCPLLISFLGEMEEPFAPVLEELRIEAYGSYGWDSVSFNKAVDGILRFGIGSHSLRELYLWGMEDWESLPDQIQHLTSLSQLTLSRFGMEELPEWIGNLSSLQELQLWFCEKLKHLPSVEAMRRLTKLTNLEICYCPLLKERCKEPKSGDDVDSEWPKISHIPVMI